MSRGRRLSLLLTILIALPALLGVECLRDIIRNPPPEGSFVVTMLEPGTHDVATPNQKAAVTITVDGQTQLTISGLPEPDEPGQCDTYFGTDAELAASIQVEEAECFPHGFRIEIFPEDNLVGTAVVGLCAVDPPHPLAPPPGTALRIGTQDPDDPGEVIILPEATPPPGLECDTQAARGSGDRESDVWRALDPFEGLFRVTPLYASPGRLGASVTAFSPFAPVAVENGQQPPPPGQDLVVYNDIDQFRDGGMADANNVTMVENLVNYTNAGSRVWADCSSAQGGVSVCTDGSFSTFRTTIGGEGLAFEPVGDLTNIPADVRVVILWIPTDPYTTAEINGLKEFASRDGRIVFVGEHSGFYGAAIGAVQNPFLEAMGSAARNEGGAFDCGFTVLPASSIVDPRHQITTGLTGLTIACASSMDPLGPNDHVLYRDTGDTENLSIVTTIDTSPITATGVVGAAAEPNPTMTEAEGLRATSGEHLVD
ncbi:MAG: hypothetical protein R3199_04040 [Gemmatimonadota bacterium]|nr:hypothetical protein [Gemmatimonadota bacterium]